MTLENTSEVVETADAAVNVAPFVGGGEILSMGVSMLIVVGVIVALGWLYSKSRIVGNAGGDLIQVVASRALGPKERLFVVDVADQQLLVGMTAGGVQTLHVFDEPVCAVTRNGPRSGFAGRLRKAFQETGK